MNDRPSVVTSKPPADEPVELARLAVRGGVERPRHVQDHGDDHHVGRPAVNVAHEASGRHDEVNVLDRLIGDVRIRLVIEHQQDAGDQRDQERRGRHDAEPHRRATSAGSSGACGPSADAERRCRR